MELISVRELFKNTEKYAGKEITVGGWVRNRRPSKQFGFIVLNDGTYFTPVQVVYPESPKQDKPKVKHPKTHINQINKDQTQRTNIKSSKGKTTNNTQGDSHKDNS